MSQRSVDEPDGEEGLRRYSDASGVDDGSFDQACYEGILEYVAANEGASVNDVKRRYRQSRTGHSRHPR